MAITLEPPIGIYECLKVGESLGDGSHRPARSRALPSTRDGQVTRWRQSRPLNSHGSEVVVLARLADNRRNYCCECGIYLLHRLAICFIRLLIWVHHVVRGRAEGEVSAAGLSTL
jgi:hypothetical protein